MNDSVNLAEMNNQPIVIKNQLYVLGNPVISAATLDRLVYVLDQVGSAQPIVIVSPEAQTVPDFETKLSNLIQNNRTAQPVSVTTNDKYRFKDMTDRQLLELASQKTSMKLDPETMLDMYRGLRARAQALYDLDLLSKERDKLWANHCANPSSNEGSDRFAELQYKLIPEAQSRYQAIAERLQKYDDNVQAVGSPASIPKPDVAATSSVPDTIQHTQEPAATVAAVTPAPEVQVEKPHKPWGPWLAAKYKVMPMSVATQMANSVSYNALRQQQRNVEAEGKVWEAVDPAYLLALGIKLIPDGVPIVYTEIGTFKRVGNSNVPLNNLDYWYPKPKGA